MAGNLAGVEPTVMDNIDIDYTIAKFSTLKGNDPRMIRTPDALAQLRQQRAQQQQQMQAAQQAQMLSQGAKNLSGADVGGGQNALQALAGAAGGGAS